MLRKVVKVVVHCDVLAEPPIEKGFEGLYDVLIESGCLLAACSTTESFKKGLVTLSRLLKSGSRYHYHVGLGYKYGANHHCIHCGKQGV